MNKKHDHRQVVIVSVSYAGRTVCGTPCDIVLFPRDICWVSSLCELQHGRGSILEGLLVGRVVTCLEVQGSMGVDFVWMLVRGLECSVDRLYTAVGIVMCSCTVTNSLILLSLSPVVRLCIYINNLNINFSQHNN
jgi:hypothetical protein